MRRRRKLFSVGPGFTLIELLVVIAIIALLVGLLAPGIKVFKRSADNLKQKSVFHGFETGLELFAKDFDGYPNSDLTGADLDDPGAPYVCGAQHLAEALVGQDEKGFDPLSKFSAPYDEANSETEVYASTAKGSSPEEIADSENRRKGPYSELKKDVGVFTIEQLFANTKDVYQSAGAYKAPVLTDVFHSTKIEVNGKKIKVGSPILYYKADAASRFFWDGVDPAAPPVETWRMIYDYEDNRPIIELGTLEDQNILHVFDDNATETDPETGLKGLPFFYNTITNPTVTSFKKPFNTKTFLLISAGWDGKFGTKDDISNFNY